MQAASNSVVNKPSLQVADSALAQRVQTLLDSKQIAPALTLNDLTDVALPTPAENSTLRFSGGAWVGKSAACIEFPDIVLGDEDGLNANSTITIRGPTRTVASGSTMYIENSAGTTANGSIFLRHKRPGYNDQFVLFDSSTYASLTGSSVSVALNVPSGLTNSVLFVSITFQENIVPPTAATYNGVAMTQLLNASGAVSAACWILSNPAAGATKLFACTNPSSVTQMVLQYAVFRDVNTLTLYPGSTTAPVTVTGLSGNETMFDFIYQNLEKTATVSSAIKLPTTTAKHGFFYRHVVNTSINNTFSLAAGFDYYQHYIFILSRITPIPDFVLTKKILYSTGFEDYSDYYALALTNNTCVALSLTTKRRVLLSCTPPLVNCTIVLPLTMYLPNGYTFEFFTTQASFNSFITFVNAIGNIKKTVYFTRDLKICINSSSPSANSWLIATPDSADVLFANQIEYSYNVIQYITTTTSALLNSFATLTASNINDTFFVNPKNNLASIVTYTSDTLSINCSTRLRRIYGHIKITWSGQVTTTSQTSVVLINSTAYDTQTTNSAIGASYTFHVIDYFPSSLGIVNLSVSAQYSTSGASHKVDTVSISLTID